MCENDLKIKKSFETKILYRESFWQYAFIKKEIELSEKEQIIYQETICLKCERKFLTRSKKVNHVCSDCNIINDNLWDNNTVYRTHINV